LVPPTREEKAQKLPDARAIERLKLASELKERGFPAEAFMLAWTSVEATLRELINWGETNRFTSSLDVLRHAYEAGVISDAELRRLERGFQLRNRLVHGFGVDDPQRAIEELLPIADALAERLTHSSEHPA
jgi:hypothetical protein